MKKVVDLVPLEPLYGILLLPFFFNLKGMTMNVVDDINIGMSINVKNMIAVVIMFGVFKVIQYVFMLKTRWVYLVQA